MGRVLSPLAFAYNTAIHATTGMQSFQMLYGRKPWLPIDLIFPTEAVFHVELEPEDLVREKEFVMKKVFEFVATIREGNLQRQKFSHDRHIRGKQFQLLDKVLLRNDQPKIDVSKKLKFHKI